MRKGFVLICLLSYAAPSGIALAQTKTPDQNALEIDSIASEHYKLAARFYNDGKYEAARVEFEAAYELTSHADLLHNLSMVAEKQERWADAIRLEEQFLSAPSLTLSQRERDEARGRLVRLRELSGTPVPTTSTRTGLASPGTEGSKRRAIPGGAIGLLAGGGIVLGAGLACGAGALATRAALHDPMGVFADQYDELVRRGQAVDRAGIALDVIGVVALASETAWALVARQRAARPQTALSLNDSPGPLRYLRSAY